MYSSIEDKIVILKRTFKLIKILSVFKTQQSPKQSMNFFPANSLVENKMSVYEERTIRLKNDAKVL